jgi:lipopolysaccharide transport system permease protein
VLNGTVDFLVGYIVTVIFAAYFSLLTVEFILVMPLLLFIQMALALGLGLLLAPYNARYRDVKHIIPLVIQLYYFANPIMYPVSVAPNWALWLFKVNPFAIVITTYRSLLNGDGPDWMLVIYALLVSVAFLAVGAFIFMRKGQDMVDVL